MLWYKPYKREILAIFQLLLLLQPPIESLRSRISKLTVPIGVAQFQLDMMNGLYGMADSFQYLVVIQDDSIDGLSGIVAYRKYDIMLETAASNMHTYFVQYGILSS